MTRPVRRVDLGLVAMSTRKVSDLLLTPCRCGRTKCTIGEHVWLSTADMAAGPRANATDPHVAGWRYEEVKYPDGTSELMPVAKDSVGEAAVGLLDDAARAHDEYKTLLSAFEAAADALDVFLLQHRPDRFIPTVETTTRADWCRNHLELIGTCEPRYRDDLCRFCYDTALIYDPENKKILPPTDLLRLRHERGPRAVTQAVFDQYMSAEKRRLQGGTKKKRKKR